MCRYLSAFLLMLIFSGYALDAQPNRANRLFRPFTDVPDFHVQSRLSVITQFTQQKNVGRRFGPLPPLPPFNYDYMPAPGAIFCRMECTVFEKYNVWLKIRAGDEESYRIMIEKPGRE